MLEPFMQFGEYIVIKYRGKPQIDMWFSWCGALALDVWKTRACKINVFNLAVSICIVCVCAFCVHACVRACVRACGCMCMCVCVLAVCFHGEDQTSVRPP